MRAAYEYRGSSSSYNENPYTIKLTDMPSNKHLCLINLNPLSVRMRKNKAACMPYNK